MWESLLSPELLAAEPAPVPRSPSLKRSQLESDTTEELRLPDEFRCDDASDGSGEGSGILLYPR